MIKPKLNWKINYRWVQVLLLAIMPGVITSFLTHDIMWLTSSFLAVCGVIPYNISHGSKSFAMVLMLIICILAYVTKFLIINDLWQLLTVFLILLGIICGTIDNMNPQLYSLSAWLIIGTVYGGVKLLKIEISAAELISIISIALLSVLLVTWIFNPMVDDTNRLYVLNIKNPDFWFNFKFVLPILCSCLVWHYARLREPEWMLWASFSIVNVDKKILIEKFQVQGIGVVVGVVLGVVVSLLTTPENSEAFTYICFILIMLGFKMFDDLFTAYLFRSFFVVMFAGIKSIDIAFLRGSSVIIGGVIGLICTYLLICLHEYVFSQNNKRI